jgi:thiol-disulfide isomerase/thioredoxin
MNKLKFFVKPDCPGCPPAKLLAKEIEQEGKLEVETYDVSEGEGLAESSFYSILGTPSIVLCSEDEEEDELKSWRSEVPTKEEVYEINKK